MRVLKTVLLLTAKGGLSMAFAVVLVLGVLVLDKSFNISAVSSPALSNKFCDDPASESQTGCTSFIPSVLAAASTPYQEVSGDVNISGNVKFGAGAYLYSSVNDNFTLHTQTNTPNPNLTIGYGNGRSAGTIDTSKEYFSMNGGEFMFFNGNLSVSGPGYNTFRNSDAAAGKSWYVGPDRANNFVIYRNTGAPWGVWLADGGTSWNANSDRRLKTSIKTLSDEAGLTAIEKLNPVSFNWLGIDSSSSTQLGFIAQQVQEIFPQLITEGPDNTITLPDGSKQVISKPLGLNYNGLIPSLVKAIQQQQEQIKLQQQEIDMLKQEVKALKAK